ncbi:uromodulin-like [Megalops cyprinoides]|uniref:uromodulin-like n=1 Tax=Megalops cyprinoides TaxID=118141 RepID=UPI00186521CC|nr:uromodulin-like [Megalops cyprinoides]
MYAKSSGTAVTSCDACHEDATCQALPVSQGALESPQPAAFSCSCRDRFAGDGLLCHNHTQCESDPLCCPTGTSWSSDHGCVDVDECSLPGDTCSPPLTCENTPGAFHCLAPATGGRSESRSVIFGCGAQDCPPGEDCIAVGGASSCQDPCLHYTVLDEAWRATNFTYGNVALEAKCDSSYEWQGWYRMFLGGSSVQMPERCVDMNMCGTHAPLWLPEGHPKPEEGVLSRRVCAHWSSRCCEWDSNPIYVKACPGNYFVYKLVDPYTCSLAYCADVNTLVCGTCKQDENCVSEDKVTWWCKKKELVCGKSMLQVGFSASELESSGLDVSSAHLADSRCTGHQESNGKVWFQVERKVGSCGTQLKTNGTHAVYSNIVIIEQNMLGHITFLASVGFPFNCAYPLDLKTSLETAITPIQVTQEVEVTGSGSRASATMSLYRSSDYTDPYSVGAVVLPLGSALYVGIHVEEVESGRFAVIMEDCHATPSASPDDPVRFYVIQNRCPIDNRLVTVEENGGSLQGRFSVYLFRFVGDYDSVFLHCSLIVCDKSEASCSQS